MDYGDDHVLQLIKTYTKKSFTMVPVTLITESTLEEWKVFKACIRKLSPDLTRDQIWKTVFRQMKPLLPNLIDLLELVRILPLSTVDCERGFSRLNLIKSDLLSRLSEYNLEYLMHVSINAKDNIENEIDEIISKWDQQKERKY